MSKARHRGEKGHGRKIPFCSFPFSRFLFMESGSLNEGVGNNHDMMVMIIHCQCLVVILASLLIHCCWFCLGASLILAIGSYGLTICRTLYYHFSPKSGDLKSQCTALKKLTDLYPKLELCSHS